MYNVTPGSHSCVSQVHPVVAHNSVVIQMVIEVPNGYGFTLGFIAGMKKLKGLIVLWISLSHNRQNVSVSLGSQAMVLH